LLFPYFHISTEPCHHSTESNGTKRNSKIVGNLAANMGCGSSADNYDTIYKTHPRVKAYQKSFERLGMVVV
jgi:hypothetical protein